MTDLEISLAKPVMEVREVVRKHIEDAFYAGKADGRQEVVEWLNKENIIKLKSLQGTGEWFKHCGLLIPDNKWQVKLKEWGIGE